MPGNKPIKSVDDLAREVLDTQEGIKSVEDLKALFETPAAPPVVPVIPQPVVVPTPAPIAVAPTAPALTAAPVEPPKGEPVLDFIPEKFRDKDVQSSVNKMSKSYTDLEAELKKERDEKANMQKILDSFSTPRPSPAPMPQVPQDVDDIEDSTFFEKPKETVAKMAERIAAQTVLKYHVEQEKARYIDGFRTQHGDFDQLRTEIMEVLAARPDLDRDQRNLPIVYEMAKQLKIRKINDLRSSLGIQQAQAPTPPAAPADQPAPVDKEKLKEELLEAIRVEIQKRRSAQGIQGATPPANPDSRLNPMPPVKPLTMEDQMLQEMMNSGPKKLSIELG